MGFLKARLLIRLTVEVDTPKLSKYDTLQSIGIMYKNYFRLEMSSIPLELLLKKATYLHFPFHVQNNSTDLKPVAVLGILTHGRLQVQTYY